MEEPSPASRVAKVSTPSGAAAWVTEGSALSGRSTADRRVVWGALLLRTLSWSPRLDSPALPGAQDTKHHDISHFRLTFARVNSFASIKDE